MKMLLCTDIRLGALCTENLDIRLSHKWQAARTEKFAELMDLAARNHVAYIALFGSLFGRKRVSESVIDTLFAAVKEEKHIQVLTFLSAEEYNRINYRNDVPENLHLICTQTADSYTDDSIALRINKHTAEIQLADNDPVCIRKAAAGSYVLSLPAGQQTIPSFEPIGFEDAEGLFWGYGILEWSETQIGPYSLVKNQKYAFQAMALKILPSDGPRGILRKINTATKNVAVDTFLRITLVGRSAFGITLNGDALKTQLQSRIFFAEVYDNTLMDVDEDAFENDISLRSEFVRLALQDDSLSESERNRLICCGWNVLNGKEVSAE